MNALFALPLSIRLALVAGVGAVLGALVNWATYRLAWHRREISPWGPFPTGGSARGVADRIPVLGWLGLRRESDLHGRGFWVRPLLIELGMAVGLAALYWWEVDQQAIVFDLVRQIFGPVPLALPLVSESLTHSIFVSHVILITFMAAASFIDIDEKLIPDDITVIGTLLGLVLMTLLPTALLPHVDLRPAPPALGEPVALPPPVLAAMKPGITAYAEPVTLAAPNEWTEELNGWPALAMALGCYWLWCFAIAPRILRRRHGICRALALVARRVFRELTRPPLGVFALAGTVAIPLVWWIGGTYWIGLLTSLLGMIVSGGLVWVVRIVGSAALGREAMGFGDVTLMMMVGTFVGWQAGVVIFFVAPFAALIIGVAQLVLHRDDVIPYGPFLCLGTLAVIIGWPSFWSTGLQAIFSIGWLMPVVLLVSFAMLGILLAVWQQIKMALFGRPEEGGTP